MEVLEGLREGVTACSKEEDDLTVKSTNMVKTQEKVEKILYG